MRPTATVAAVVVGGSLSLVALSGLTSGRDARTAAPGPTTSAPAGAVLQAEGSPTARAVARVLPPGHRVRASQVVRSGGADYERVEADGPDGAFDVTVYDRFDRSELAGAGLARSTVPGGVVWVGSEGPSSRSIYFLSSTGEGMRIGHTVRAGGASSIAGLEALALRLAPLVRNAR